MIGALGSQPHRERRLLLDRDAEDSPSGIVGRQHPALHRRMRNCLELLALTLPEHLAAPAQSLPAYSAGKRYITNHGISSRPPVQERLGPAIADAARRHRCDANSSCNAGSLMKPRRSHTGSDEIDPGHAPRIGRALIAAVGGKGEGLLRKAVRTPATEFRGIATTLRRVSGLEFLRHQSERFARKPGFERAARTDRRERRCGLPRCAAAPARIWPSTQNPTAARAASQRFRRSETVPTAMSTVAMTSSP